MLRFILALVVASAAQTAMAQCPGGVCPRPVRSIVAARPTLAPRRPAATVHREVHREHSIVRHRGYAPRFWARLTFRPSPRFHAWRR